MLRPVRPYGVPGCGGEEVVVVRWLCDGARGGSDHVICNCDHVECVVECGVGVRRSLHTAFDVDVC